MKRRRISLLLAAAAALAGASASAQEDPTNIVADQIRAQGYKCDSPQSAKRDAQASILGEAVWILQCESGSYRVRLTPDMAATVERLDKGQESRFSPYAGGQAELDLAKRAILASLKDPNARFGSATFYQRDNDGAKFLCIYVSTKNSVGAYGGMHPATVSFKDGKVVDVDFLNAKTAVPCERRVRN